MWALRYLGAVDDGARRGQHPSATRGGALAWLAVALIFAAFGQLIAHGVAMRAELDTVI